MSRFIRSLKRALSSIASPSITNRTSNFGLPSNQIPKFLISRKCSSSGNYISEMKKSAFQDKILRLIRHEIDYELDHNPPAQAPSSYGPFTIDERPGEQWIILKSKFEEKEDIKIEATMFDKSVQVSDPKKLVPEFELHISFVVNITKDNSGETLEILCSAWPDSIEISKLCIRKGIKNSPSSYNGPTFEELDDELQDALYQFLEERGISDDLARFLHMYMKNKDKGEYIKWMERVKSYVEQK